MMRMCVSECEVWVSGRAAHCPTDLDPAAHNTHNTTFYPPLVIAFSSTLSFSSPRCPLDRHVTHLFVCQYYSLYTLRWQSYLSNIILYVVDSEIMGWITRSQYNECIRGDSIEGTKHGCE